MGDFTEISARENKLVKQVIRLQTSAKARREDGLFVLEGLRICDDARENGVVFERLIVSKSALEKFSDEIGKFAEISGFKYLVPDQLFKIMADTDSPQGIMAVARIPENSAYLNPKGRYIALENIADPSNLGAVARTAEALGVSGLIIAGGCDAFAPKSLRASMGTLLRMPIYMVDDISELESTGLTTYACVVEKSAKPITDINFSDGCVIVIGNEANGITEETKRFCDYNITIPMNGKAESLNAAVAASIAMWEMIKC